MNFNILNAVVVGIVSFMFWIFCGISGASGAYFDAAIFGIAGGSLELLSAYDILNECLKI